MTNGSLREPGLAMMTPRRRRALEAWDRWLAAAGPWHLWAQGVPLLGPGLDELGVVKVSGNESTAEAWLPRVERCLVGAPPTLLVLDLSPVFGIQVARRVAGRGWARPVPVLGRWPSRCAALPSEALVSTLLVESRRLPAPAALADARHAVLVMDGERHGIANGVPRRRTDNRYDQLPDCLPDGASLAAAGIGRVVEWYAASGGNSLAAARYAGTAVRVEREHVRAP